MQDSGCDSVITRPQPALEQGLTFGINPDQAAVAGGWTFTPMPSCSHPPTSRCFWAALRNRVMTLGSVTLFSPGHHPEGLQATVTPTWGVLQYLSDTAWSLPSVRTDHCQKLIWPELSGLGFSLVFLPLFFPFLPPFHQPLIDALLCSKYTLMRSGNSNIF